MNLPAQLEPHTRAYMLRLLQEGGKPLPALSLEAARQYMRQSQSAPLRHPSVEVKTIAAAGTRLTIVRPANNAAPLPAVLYLHGGGWVLGGVATHGRIVRELAVRANAVIVVPEYSLSPEARFPVALEQCYATALWMRAEGAKHGIDGSRIAVAGDSAGGNLAAAVALWAAQRSGPKLALQALLCPALQAASTTGSYAEFAEGLNLTRDAMEWFWAQYVPEGPQRSDPAVSPLLAELTDLARVAPALIVTAECDVLRDDGELYARRLAEAGTEVTASRFLGTLHNFPVIDDLQDSGPSIAALRLIADSLKSSLYGLV